MSHLSQSFYHIYFHHSILYLMKECLIMSAILKHIKNRNPSNLFPHITKYESSVEINSCKFTDLSSKIYAEKKITWQLTYFTLSDCLCDVISIMCQSNKKFGLVFWFYSCQKVRSPSQHLIERFKDKE